jgi:hypothetical protein
MTVRSVIWLAGVVSRHRLICKHRMPMRVNSNMGSPSPEAKPGPRRAKSLPYASRTSALLFVKVRRSRFSAVFFCAGSMERCSSLRSERIVETPPAKAARRAETASWSSPITITGSGGWCCTAAVHFDVVDLSSIIISTIS